MANNLPAASVAPTPMRVTFGNPPTILIEFTVSRLRKCEPCYIQLYKLDWTVSNYSMIKCVSGAMASPIFPVEPYDNLEMKFFLGRNGDNLKIEIHLSQDTKLTEEMKTKESNCPLVSKIRRNITDLLFLDQNGKTIDHYRSLPCEFELINTSKVFVWVKEENVSRFINKDSLTIRAKLSIRYYPHASDVDESSDVKSTKVLMKDMKNLFNDRNLFPDVLIKVGGQFILAHKCILYSQCPYFAEMPKSDLTSEEKGLSILEVPSSVTKLLQQHWETINIPNENADVFLSVLNFIYCRQMFVTDSVNDFAVYEFARKYGVRQLGMLMMASEMKVHSEIKVEKLNYTWYVENFSSLCKTPFVPIHSPNFKTKTEADITWSVVLYCLDSRTIYLNLQRNSGFNLDVQTRFKLGICGAYGVIHDSREFQCLFKSGAITDCHPTFINSVSRFCITPDLLFNDTLTVFCDLSVSTDGIMSKVKYTIPGEYRNIDLAHWTHNFRDLLEKQSFSDATLIVDDKEFKIHKAVLSARSPVFARMFKTEMEEKRSGCVRIEDICSTVMSRALS